MLWMHYVYDAGLRHGVPAEGQLAEVCTDPPPPPHPFPPPPRRCVWQQLLVRGPTALALFSKPRRQANDA